MNSREGDYGARCPPADLHIGASFHGTSPWPPLSCGDCLFLWFAVCLRLPKPREPWAFPVVGRCASEEQLHLVGQHPLMSGLLPTCLLGKAGQHPLMSRERSSGSLSHCPEPFIPSFLVSSESFGFMDSSRTHTMQSCTDMSSLFCLVCHTCSLGHDLSPRLQSPPIHCHSVRALRA